jgi:hypothetical protein
MDTDKLIIDLLSNPADTKKNTDIDIWNVLVKEVYAVIDKPQTEQPVEVMAQTIMDAIFKGCSTITYLANCSTSIINA